MNNNALVFLNPEDDKKIVSEREMLDAGIISEAGESPAEYEHGIKNVIQLKKDKVNNAIHQAVLLKQNIRPASLVSLPLGFKSEDLDKIISFNKFTKEQTELGDKNLQMLSRQDFDTFKKLEDFTYEKLGVFLIDDQKRKYLYFILQLLLDNNIKLKRENQLAGVIRIAQSASSKKDLFIIKTCLENNIRILNVDLELYKKIHDLPLFEQVARQTKDSYLIKRHNKFYNLFNTYINVLNLGDSYLDEMVNADRKVLKIINICTLNGFENLKLDYYSSPLLVKLINKITIDDIGLCMKVFNYCSKDHSPLNIEHGFLYGLQSVSLEMVLITTQYITKNKDILEKFLSTPIPKNLLNSEPIELLVYFNNCQNKDSFSNHPYTLTGDEMNMRMKVCIKNNTSYIDEICEKFNIKNTIQKESIGSNSIHDMQSLYFQTYNLSIINQNPDFTDFLKTNYNIKSLKELILFSNDFLNNKYNKDFNERIKIINLLMRKLNAKSTDYIDGLSKLLNNDFEIDCLKFLLELNNDLNFNIIKAFEYKDCSLASTKLKQWMEHPEIYRKAIGSGLLEMFEDNDNYNLIETNLAFFHLVDTLINNPSLLAFYKNNIKDILPLHQMDEHDNSMETLEKWSSDVHVFQWAKKNGVFKEPKNFWNYRNLNLIISNKSLLAFVLKNNEGNLLNKLIKDNISNTKIKCEQLNKWIRKPRLFSLLKYCGLINGIHDDGQNIFRYEDFAPLNHLSEKRMNKLEYLAVCDDEMFVRSKKHQTVLLLLNDFHLSSIPDGLMTLLIKIIQRPKLLKLSTYCDPLFAIKFNNNFHVDPQYKLENGWIARISKSMEDEVLAYFKEANITYDFADNIQRERTYDEVLNAQDGAIERPISVNELIKQYNLPDDFKPDLEAVFLAETSSWLERRRLIDFVSLTKFNIKNSKQFHVLKKIAQTTDTVQVAELYNYFISKTPPPNGDYLRANNIDYIVYFEKHLSTFGILKSHDIFDKLYQISNNIIPNDLKGKIENTGDKGLIEFKNYVNSSIKQLTEFELEIDPKQLTEFELDRIRYLVKFDTSQWKRKKDFRYMLKEVFKYKESGELPKVEDEYIDKTIKLRKPSKIVDLKKYEENYNSVIDKIKPILIDAIINRLKELNINTKEDLNYLSEYNEDIDTISSLNPNMFEMPNHLSLLGENINLEEYNDMNYKECIISLLKSELSKKLNIINNCNKNNKNTNANKSNSKNNNKPVNESKIVAINKDITKITKIINAIECSQDHASIVDILTNCKYKKPELNKVLKDMIISDFLIKNPEWDAHLFRIINTNRITIKNINKIIEFFSIQVKDHGIGNNTDTERADDWLYPNLNNKQRRRLKKLFGARQLKEIQSLANSEAGEVHRDDFKFKPSKYIMGELSGYFSDACWTSKDSIILNNPNMTPIICIQSPENMPRIMGASLIFENSINNGKDKVLILRGINPNDKLLDKISAKSYCEEMIKYAKEVAKKKGIKYIMANTKQGIISNRPSIVSYFEELENSFKRNTKNTINLRDVISLDKQMDFNGYDIKNDSQIISIID